MFRHNMTLKYQVLAGKVVVFWEILTSAACIAVVLPCSVTGETSALILNAVYLSTTEELEDEMFQS